MNFARAVQVLVDNNVEFIVIGGLSAMLHGSAQVTFDLDVCYSRQAINFQRLATALAPFHPRPRGFPAALPFLWDERTLSNGALFTLQTDIGPIDLLAEVKGLGTFEDLKQCSTTLQAFDRTIQTLDLAALITSKRAAGRPKDLAFLLELESILEANRPYSPKTTQP